MRYSRTIPVLVLALGMFARPASAAPNKEHLQLLAEIRMLQEQQQMLQAALGTLQDTLKAVTSKLDEQAATERKAQADQTLALTNIRDNMQALREKTDETNVRISSVSQDIEALRQSIAAQMQPPAPTVAPGTPGASPTGTNPAPGGGTNPAPPGGTSPTTSPATAAPTTPPVGVSPQKMFDSSWDDYAAARYDLAIQGFTEYLASFGTFPNAAQAQYNIGQSYYAEKKFTDARDAYQKVISSYPQQADVVADAYYKLGQTYEQLNQIDEAKKAYQTVVDKYQSSDIFPLARQALARLNGRS